MVVAVILAGRLIAAMLAADLKAETSILNPLVVAVETACRSDSGHRLCQEQGCA
jgi:hypothetical protein